MFSLFICLTVEIVFSCYSGRLWGISRSIKGIDHNRELKITFTFQVPSPINYELCWLRHLTHNSEADVSVRDSLVNVPFSENVNTRLIGFTATFHFPYVMVDI